MPRTDEAHRKTDVELAKLEKRIKKLYKETSDELQSTIDDYFESFAKRDAEMQKLVSAGNITEQQYKQWRLNQIGRGERYQALRNKVAKRMTEANAVAVAYVNDATPGIYTLNRNYSAYTIEKVSGDVGFELWDEQTVKRLAKEQPNLMPYYPKDRVLKRGIDLAYGKKQITACVTSSILQGKSIKGMANDLQERITTMNRTSAVRTARTAVTGAQNAGRMDSYAAAEKMGIKIKKEWLATLDGRTRHSHAVLDGEQVAQDKKFSNGCRYPGDPQGPAWEIYNCRCTLVAAIDGIDTSSAQRRARDGIVPNMTYAQWETSKRGYAGQQLTMYHTGNERRVRDVSRKYLETARPHIGKVRYEKGYRAKDHKIEIEVANQIKEQLGGKIVLLKEANKQGVKTPDYFWRGGLWELKSISTATAADTAVRSAIKQIRNNPGGIILRCQDNIDVGRVIEVTDARAMRNFAFNFDVVALNTNGSLSFARRYKK